MNTENFPLEFAFTDTEQERFFSSPQNKAYLDALEEATCAAMRATTLGFLPGVAGVFLNTPEDFKKLGEIAFMAAGDPSFLGLYVLRMEVRLQLAIIPMSDLTEAKKVGSCMERQSFKNPWFVFTAVSARI